VNSLLLLAAPWVHDVNPYVIKLWEGGPIRWYGMVYLFGFTIAYFLMLRATRKGVSSLRDYEVADFVTTLAIMVVVGSRVGYALFYKPSLLGFSSEPPFWQMLAFHKGGMSAHGGVLGLLIGTIYISRKYKHRWMHLADLCAFAGAIGLFFGRLTNFINGELYGRVVKEGEVFAATGIKFPGEMREWTSQQVTLLATKLQPIGLPEGSHPVEWAIAQIQAKNAAVTEAVAPLLTVRYPSQLLQAMLEGLTAWLLVAIFWRKPRKPGYACAIWLAGYGVARFIAEFWRQPDAHIADQEFAATGFSRGQYLCFVMILCGIVLAAFARKTDAPRMGGWLGSTDEDQKAWDESDGAGERFCGAPPDPEQEAAGKDEASTPAEAEPEAKDEPEAKGEGGDAPA